MMTFLYPLYFSRLFLILTCFLECECWRMQCRTPDPDKKWGYSNDPSGSDRVDAIDFQTDGEVMLSGYRLWGVRTVSSTSFMVTISLYRGNSLIASETGTYNTSTCVQTFKVHFSQEIAISANVTYTAAIRIVTYEKSFAHEDGIASTSCSGVNVDFKNSPIDTNYSDEWRGQIPALILLSSRC